MAGHCQKEAQDEITGIQKRQALQAHRSDALLLIVVQVPKPPKKDFYKLMNKDKIVLRFSTRFVETPTHQLSSSDRSDPPPVYGNVQEHSNYSQGGCLSYAAGSLHADVFHMFRARQGFPLGFMSLQNPSMALR